MAKHTWLGPDVDFDSAWELQRDQVSKMLSANAENTCYYLEHSPVYTIGRTRDQSSLRDQASLPFPVVEINRGGEGTYHGPGQLVGYPILNLSELGKDLHLYIRSLEQVLIATCEDFGLKARRRKGLTGVWVDDKKIASIGVGVKKWISMHGFAINITEQSIPPFSSITPCGIDHVQMTSVCSEISRSVSVKQFAKACEPHLDHQLDLLRQE